VRHPPEAGLAPALGTAERAHFYKWLIWLTNTLQSTLIIYFYTDRWMDAGNSAGVAELKSHAETKVGLMLDQLDAELARLEKRMTGPGCWARTFGGGHLHADAVPLDAQLFIQTCA
jgi:hypothetical protein